MGRAVEEVSPKKRKKETSSSRLIRNWKPNKTKVAGPTQTPVATACNEGGNKEDAAVVVNIEDEFDTWNEQIRNELQKHMNQSLSEEPVIIIPRVPQRLRYDNDVLYDPRIISIGPYHKDRDNLEPMEKHKWQYLDAVLERNKQVKLEDYAREIKALELRARNYYTGDFPLKGQMAFVQTMLLDGCFIVEYLLVKNADGDSNLGGMIWMEDLLFHDLLLLENQLPFFVLQLIFDLATKTTEKSKAIPSSLIEVHEAVPSSLSQVVINFFNKMFSAERTDLPQEPIHHLLHFYHWFFLSTPRPTPSDNAPKSFRLKWLKHFIRFHAFLSLKRKGTAAISTPTNKKECVNMIPNAMVLRKAGIKFKKREVERGSILDVKFNDGVMEIPHLLIDDFTETQFRNLIAFEQFYPDTEAKFTAYIMFLDNVVNTSEDVALLHRNGIIEHMFGSDEEVAHLFNVLIKGIFRRRQNYLSCLYRDVDQYCRSRRHRWWASFLHKYLNSPLKIMSMVAAVILLLLTFLQTFFSIYSYFKPT